MLGVTGDSLRCTCCGAAVAVSCGQPFDPVDDRAQWPELPCEATEACPGTFVPEALN